MLPVCTRGGDACCPCACSTAFQRVTCLEPAGGCCFDFNREQETLFVVGAEDGSLYKCSTAYASEYLQVGLGKGGGKRVPSVAC